MQPFLNLAGGLRPPYLTSRVLHEHGGFTVLFEVLAGFGLLVLLGALLFPMRRDEITRAPLARPQPAAAE